MGIIVIKMCFCGPSYDTKDRSGLKVLLLILPLIHGGRELQGTMECIHKPPPPFRLLVTLLFILFISVSPVSFAIYFRYYCSSSFSSFLLLQYTFVSFLSTFSSLYTFSSFCSSLFLSSSSSSSFPCSYSEMLCDVLYMHRGLHWANTAKVALFHLS